MPVQNSGITVDDSGNVSSDLTMSKAGPTFRVNASSGDATATLDGAAGTTRSCRFRTGTSLRWFFGASNDAESGSDVGSDFRLVRYNDAGAGLGDAPLHGVLEVGPGSATMAVQQRTPPAVLGGPANGVLEHSEVPYA